MKEVAAAEKALNAKTAQSAVTAAKGAAKGASAKEAAAAAKQLAADEKAQAIEDAKTAPTFSVRKSARVGVRRRHCRMPEETHSRSCPLPYFLIPSSRWPSSATSKT